jgi:nicotinamide mononucleotide (NMN) deamidase PncC
VKRDQRNITVRKIHDAPQQGVFYVTGGGSLFLSDLLTVPGASNTVLEAQIPYSSEALADVVGSSDIGACSDETARRMAVGAYLRASTLSATSGKADAEAFGFAITASLASVTNKRGIHRAHIAMQTRTTTQTWFAELRKGARTRDSEERVCHNAFL